MAHNKFKEIMALTEKLPNNMELGAAVRRIYWSWWEGSGMNPDSYNPNQLKLDFPEDPKIDAATIDADIDSVATRALD